MEKSEISFDVNYGWIWELENEGELEMQDKIYRYTKQERLEAAKDYSVRHRPSKIEIYRKDGKLQRTITYEVKDGK